MRRPLSAAIRLPVEAAFLVLVAVGAALAELEPIVIGALVAAAAVLVALVERAFRREAARAAAGQPEAEEPEPAEVESPRRVVEAEPEPIARASEPEPAPKPTVSERSARAILATGPPPVPETLPEREPGPEPEPVTGGAPREWNIWELERLVREHPDERRQEEWSALVLSLREFARADGMLPVEFDDLVRETFGAMLVTASTEAAAAP